MAMLKAWLRRLQQDDNGAGYLLNDIRRMLNMNSIGPSGDIYLQPLNMIEAGTQAVEDQYKKHSR